MSETYTPNSLKAGDFPIVTDSITIGAASLTVGAVLGISVGGNFFHCDKSETVSGVAVPKAVLLEACDASSAPVPNVPVQLTGEVNANVLTCASGTAIADVKEKMREVGLFVKTPVNR